MRLIDLCDPIFELVCRVNRIGRRKGELTYADLRSDVVGVFLNTVALAKEEGELENKFKLVQKPLIYFVDSMIAESGIGCAAEWDANRLAHYKKEEEGSEITGQEKDFRDYLESVFGENGDYGGDQAFFEHSDKALVDGDIDVIMVFYCCLGLGFEGFYSVMPRGKEKLRDELGKFAAKLKEASVNLDLQQKVTPDAYQYTDRTNLTVTAAPAMWGFVAVAVALAVFVVVVSGVIYNQVSSDLRESVKRVNEYEAQNSDGV